MEKQRELIRANLEKKKKAERLVPDRDDIESDFKKINRDYRKTKKN